jgi:hypothetical protein
VQEKTPLLRNNTRAERCELPRPQFLDPVPPFQNTAAYPTLFPISSFYYGRRDAGLLGDLRFAVRDHLSSLAAPCDAGPCLTLPIVGSDLGPFAHLRSNRCC